MKKILIIVSCSVITLITSRAYSIDPVPISQPQFPLVLWQPEDQLVKIGAPATFTVQAENAEAYQWLHNGNVINGETNNTFSIQKAGIDDVGYYTCDVFKGFQYVPTRAASLMVYTNSIDPQTGVDPMTIYSFPLFGNGSQGACPGAYTGYVLYTPGGNNWGWAPDTTGGNTTFYATDTNRPNTKIEYFGEYGDSGCNQTTATVPNPPMSPLYQFTIYFTNNVPTNAYPITLDGFVP